MRTISVTMNVTLDGVVQGLGRPDEDTRNGFVHGGWGANYQDDILMQEMGRGMAEPGEILFGRRTWEDFIGAWSTQTDGNPFTEHMNAVQKYVVSSSLAAADAWQNSTLLAGDAVQSVGALKATPGPKLNVIGSAALVRSLHAAGLLDSYTLVIHPLVLGSGARLFDKTSPRVGFELVRSVPTTAGVIVATYERSL
ncbi:dihydrofolate reductase family protein [Antrihabitans stalactiti]|uniref:Deaminase n=1 Tax=Antrihabitans stalactiti TaxID=2584121 RepID=A0A848KM37_9NOCA|nr:dihydrofolate reductase family protein [Antrihabitans stalactiti]NMN97330.1 deaminase [Antrihabitans stalactiti]